MRTIVGALVVLAGVLLSGFAYSQYPWDFMYPELTHEQIADNYAEFYSVYLDRSDIKNGTFRLSPGPGDRFALNVSEPLKIQMREEGITKKDLSDDGRTLEVRTKTLSWFRVFNLGEPVTREVMIRVGKKDLAVPVKIGIRVRNFGYLDDEDTAKKLQNLAERPHVVRGVVTGDDFREIRDSKSFRDGLRQAEDKRDYELMSIRRKILADDQEYTELSKIATERRFTSQEERKYYTAWERAIDQAKERVGPVENFIDPNILADEVFYVKVRLEKIDDITLKMEK